MTKQKFINLACCFQMIVCMAVFSATPALTQRRPDPREVVVESNRQEMDALLLRKPITGAVDNSVRQAVLKQINDDFRDLQLLNNKMMAEATAPKEVNYKFIANTISQIGSKATRLKSNLALPRADEDKETKLNIEDASQFRSALMSFDRVVVSFATNPIFQKVNVVELDLANQASSDLAVIIKQSSKLKKIADKLAKGAKSTN